MDNLTDQQHIDALSEPVKDALAWTDRESKLIEEVKEQLRGDYTDAGMDNAFFRWPIIERALRDALKCPKRDPVEELAADLEKAWYAYTDDKSWQLFMVSYLIERGLLNMESVK